jgi:hypothetical protein
MKEKQPYIKQQLFIKGEEENFVTIKTRTKVKLVDDDKIK